jgi:hypothetical protein
VIAPWSRHFALTPPEALSRELDRSLIRLAASDHAPLHLFRCMIGCLAESGRGDHHSALQLGRRANVAPLILSMSGREFLRLPQKWKRFSFESGHRANATSSREKEAPEPLMGMWFVSARHSSVTSTDWAVARTMAVGNRAALHECRAQSITVCGRNCLVCVSLTS